MNRMTTVLIFFSAIFLLSQVSPQRPPTIDPDSHLLSMHEYCGYTTKEFETVFAFIVEILQKDKSGNHNYLSTGSLINKRVVLTTAFAVEGKQANTLSVRVKENVIYDVSEIKIHPKFSSKNQINDIALVFLANPVKLTAAVRVICAPIHPYQIYDDMKCYGPNWTKPMRISSLTSCGGLENAEKSFICAQQEDYCPKKGQRSLEGNAIVCYKTYVRGERYVLIGIYTHYADCGTSALDSDYVNVPYFSSWIVSELKKKQLSIY